MTRVFLLSPANCNGLRARWLLRKNSRGDLAVRLRASGATLGETFSFLSALYFRGKLTYARAFTRPPAACPGIFIITPNAGLIPHDRVIRLTQLRAYSRVPINLKNRRYAAAMRQSAKRLAAEAGPECEIILLGSLATGKYLNILRPIFGNRLRVPAEFIGLGDMSRGGLLLRCVRENRELDYIEADIIATAIRKRSRADKRVPNNLPRQGEDSPERPPSAAGTVVDDSSLAICKVESGTWRTLP
jgi:hypothetical protein